MNTQLGTSTGKFLHADNISINDDISENFEQTPAQLLKSDCDMQTIMFEQERQESADFDNLDFGVPELRILIQHLKLKSFKRAISQIQNKAILTEIPLYKLFCVYFSIWYNCEEVYSILMEESWGTEPYLTIIDQKAWELLRNYSYKQMMMNAEECRENLTELIMYRAFDYNVPEVFSHALLVIGSVKLRHPDILTLINYKHYNEMQLTFQKQIKKGIMNIFFDKSLKIDVEQHHHKYCLAFYLEVMIQEGFGDDEVIELANLLIDHLSISEATSAFIREGRFELVKWVSSLPNFEFKIQYLGMCIHYESFEVFMFFKNQHKDFIKKQQWHLPIFTIQSFKKSNQYLIQKMYMIYSYFTAFSVMDFETILAHLSKQYASKNPQDNPFLYVRNPIALGTFQIYIMRDISRKFKSLEVKCMELSEYIEHSLLKLLDSIDNIDTIQDFILEELNDGFSPLFFMAELKLYRLIQHRNVQEVISQIYKSEYSIETSVNQSFSVFKIMLKDRINSSVDYEQNYRFYKLTYDRDTAQQNSLMYHIWKKNSQIRFLIEFFSTISFMLIESFTVLLLLAKLPSFYLNYAVLQAFEQYPDVTNVQIYNPVSLSVLYNSCEYVLDNGAYGYFLMYTAQYTMALQVLFFAKILNERLFIYKTGRRKPFYDMYNLLQLVLGILGLYEVFTLCFFKQPIQDISYLCAAFGGLNDEEISQFQKYQNIFATTELEANMYAVDILLLQILGMYWLKLFEKVGVLVKIISRMVNDFIKFQSLYLTIMAIFLMVGFFLFIQWPDFKTFSSVFLFLFNASVGNFSFDDVVNTDNKLLREMSGDHTTDFVIKAYLAIWLLLSNIMMINLLIAMFSDSYNKLMEVANGMFIIDIVQMNAEKMYDKHYSGLVSFPFPFCILLQPFYFGYIWIQSEAYNNFVLRLSHFLIVVITIPLTLLTTPILLALSYLKCIATKFILVLKNRGEKFSRLFELVLFLIFGLPILLLDTVVDSAIMIYLLYKPEEKLQRKNHKEEVNVNSLFLLQMHENLELGKHPKKQKTKDVLNEVRTRFKVEEKVTALLMGLGNRKELLEEVKSFARLKQFIIELSVTENRCMYIYWEMGRAIMKEIMLIQKMTTHNHQKGYSHKVQKNQVSNTDKENALVDVIKQSFFKAQIGKVADAFLPKDTESKEEKVCYDFLEKTFKELSKFANQGKQELAEYAVSLHR